MEHFDALIQYTGKSLDFAKQGKDAGNRSIALAHLGIAEGLLRQACIEALNSVTQESVAEDKAKSIQIEIVEH